MATAIIKTIGAKATNQPVDKISEAYSIYGDDKGQKKMERVAAITTS
jgi:BRCT domain type II-containing protein